MLKEVGRLESDDIKELEKKVQSIFKLLNTQKSETAEKRIHKIANTANYFVREEFGKMLSKYESPEVLDPICEAMLDHKIYGIRATGLFYFYYTNQSNPRRIIEILEKTLDNVPWESESIAFDLWKRHAEVMKPIMLEWQKSENEKKRSLSMHGMENIVSRDPDYVMNFLANVLDDSNVDVQKKITHVLTQIGRLRPAKCYSHIRKWLLVADEKRIKTIWVTMKKLANILVQRSKREKSNEFIAVTQRTVKEWKHDSNPNVSHMGNKLGQILNRN